MPVRIDLTELVGENVFVLAGMERGLAAREKFNLDDVDASADTAIIVAPRSLEAISPSFVQGFFYNSLHKIGESGITKKYDFDMDALLIEDIQDGLKRLKMKRNIAGH